MDQPLYAASTSVDTLDEAELACIATQFLLMAATSMGIALAFSAWVFFRYALSPA
jgi:hypothetical protein